MAQHHPPLDHALRRIAWRDLVPMRPRDGLIECLHPLPWLAGSLAAATFGIWPLAALASFLFFLTALRLNHEAIHHNLGFTPRGHRIVLQVLSALMLGSNNSVAFNHLHHHSKVGTEDDIEGRCGHMTAWQVLCFGPRFPVETHIYGWRNGGPALRRRMVIDLALNLTVITTALATQWPPLLYHIAAMLAAQCLTAFFAVWITHHGCDGTLIARTQRGRMLNLLSYNMFFHLEHHLFPAVPVSRLPTLAERIDTAAPGLEAKMVVPIRLYPSRPTGVAGAQPLTQDWMTSMEKPFRYRFGAALALLAAGPIFILALMLITALTGQTQGGLGALSSLLTFAIFSIPFGVAFSAIPILVGGLVMGWLGVDARGSRNPVIWGIAGAITAQPVAPMFFGGLEDAAITGAICALIVRYGTRWSDDSA